MTVKKIISGGQTGVDRAALDAAIVKEIEHGGFCSKNRMAEDGRIAIYYQLTEINETDSAVRTKKNIEESDGTLIISYFPLKGGTQLTADICREINKPVFLLNVKKYKLPSLYRWIEENNIEVLNIAGPSENESSLYKKSRKIIEQFLSKK